MKCTWENKDKTDKCNRDVFNDSPYCLFHKPKKSNEESLLFWAVINFDPFNSIRADLRNIFYQNFSFDFGAGIDFGNSVSILKYFIKPGIITYNLNNDQKSNLELGIDFSISNYLQNTGIDPHFYQTIIEQWKISGLHGSDSGYFNGFIFPAEGIFNYKYFRLNQMNLFDFAEVIYESQCRFDNYDFGRNNVHFIDVHINRQISFENAIFSGSVIFKNTNLNTQCEFNGRYPFYNTNFQGQNLTFDGGSIANLYGIKLSENTNLVIEDNVKVLEIRLEYMADIGMVNAEKETFLIAKNQAEKRGEYDFSSKYLQLEKKAERKQLILFYKERFKRKNKLEGTIQKSKYLKDKHFYYSYLKFIWNFLSEKTVGYGERPTRALFSSVAFIIFYGLIYSLFNLLKESDLGRSMFFSIVTFTTVGYGNNYPESGLGEIFSASEMFLGVTFIAIWTATIIRKMAR
jgi:hypothetical protein